MTSDDANELAKRLGDNVKQKPSSSSKLRCIHSGLVTPSFIVGYRAVWVGIQRCTACDAQRASLADTYRSKSVTGCAQAKPARRHTLCMRFKFTCNRHVLTIQMNRRNGRRITKADPLRAPVLETQDIHGVGGMDRYFAAICAACGHPRGVPLRFAVFISSSA
jgi:hypothetical protein